MATEAMLLRLTPFLQANLDKGGETPHATIIRGLLELGLVEPLVSEVRPDTPALLEVDALASVLLWQRGYP